MARQTGYEAEERIRANLEPLEPSRTILVVTHRLEVAAQADRIVVLHERSIVETGTDIELQALDGVYAGMVAERDDMVPWI
jgi:ATP-binding cassette subfamily B protein